MPDCLQLCVDMGGFMGMNGSRVLGGAPFNVAWYLRAGDPELVFVDVNLRPPWWHRHAVHDLLQRAQRFAAALVGQRGATIDDRSFYRNFAHQWQLAD